MESNDGKIFLILIDSLTEPIIEKFRISKTNFFGCSKIIEINLKITREELLFSQDEQFKKLFLTIKLEDVIAVNKRQINKDDVNKISIHYKTLNKKIGKNVLNEIKIKTFSRVETEFWIHRLRSIIKPVRYEFLLNKSESKVSPNNNNSTSISLLHKVIQPGSKNQILFNNMVMRINPKDLFTKISNLEFIYQRRKIFLFFKILRNNQTEELDLLIEEKDNETVKDSFYIRNESIEFSNKYQENYLNDLEESKEDKLEKEQPIIKRNPMDLYRIETESNKESESDSFSYNRIETSPKKVERKTESPQEMSEFSKNLRSFQINKEEEIQRIKHDSVNNHLQEEEISLKFEEKEQTTMEKEK